jgi:hypothetical protein
MKSVLLVLAAVAGLVLGVAARGAATSPAPTMFSPPREQVLYGHIKTLTRVGARYQLRFDPAWWLGGTTANRAAVEDRVIPPGDVVPNDYYIRDETHRLLTYRVPLTARATVITRTACCLRSTVIPISELAQIVRGRNPRHRLLYVPGNQLGFWARAVIDTVRSLDQQYQP